MKGELPFDWFVKLPGTEAFHRGERFFQVRGYAEPSQTYAEPSKSHLTPENAHKALPAFYPSEALQGGKNLTAERNTLLLAAISVNLSKCCQPFRAIVKKRLRHCHKLQTLNSNRSGTHNFEKTDPLRRVSDGH